MMRLLIIIGIVMLLALGGVWVLVNGRSITETDVVDDKPLILHSPQVSPIINKSPLADSVKEESTVILEDVAKLKSVEGYTGSGTATRIFNDTTFTHSIIADLPDPAFGKFYEGWLVSSTPTLRFFSTGKVVLREDKYVLIYTDFQNYPEHNEVVITEETLAQGLDGKPEAHVLEGSF